MWNRASFAAQLPSLPAAAQTPAKLIDQDQLVDTVYRGQPRKLLLAKLLARRQTWTRGIGPDGRAAAFARGEAAYDCPVDAANWDSAAYSLLTRFYVLTLEQCRASRRPTIPACHRHRYRNGALGDSTCRNGLFEDLARRDGDCGGLLLYGDTNGGFAAADDRHGKQYVATVACPNILCFGLPN